MKIRAYEKGDEQAIMALDERELPSRWNKRTIENWYWKFTERNPAGHAAVWVAEDGGELIAHFAAVPYRLKVFDMEILASHSIGSLVDRRYQNRGLIKFVGERMFDELKARGVMSTWGFPNQRAHQVQKVFLGYDDLILFDTWKIEDSDIICKRSGRFTPVTQFDDRVDKLWHTCKKDYPIAVVRNQKFLNWRYFQRPDQTYYSYVWLEEEEVRGYVVLKLYEEGEILRGHIIDIFAPRQDRETFSGLIEGALCFFKDHAVHEVTCWIWGNSLIEELVQENGFQRMKTAKPLIFRVNLDFKYPAEIKDNAHWFFAMGDSTEIF